MDSIFLNQTLSQFCQEVAPSKYVSPTVQNLTAGTYISEILDVKEIVNSDGSLEAIDFYHCLTDSAGNVKMIRFRYYEKELPALAKMLLLYPQVTTWRSTIGLHESIDVKHKATGQYMYIVCRQLSTSSASTPSSSTPSNSMPAKKTGIFGSKRPAKGISSLAGKKQTLLSDEDDDDGDDEWGDILDED